MRRSLLVLALVLASAGAVRAQDPNTTPDPLDDAASIVMACVDRTPAHEAIALIQEGRGFTFEGLGLPFRGNDRGVIRGSIEASGGVRERQMFRPGASVEAMAIALQGALTPAKIPFPARQRYALVDARIERPDGAYPATIGFGPASPLPDNTFLILYPAD